MNCVADATDVVFLERKKKKWRKSARGLFLRHCGSEALGFISRPERTHLANAVDFVARRRTPEKNGECNTDIGEARRARSHSKKSREHGERRGLFDGKYISM
ncbi:hypothetical protein EAG_08269 [Camponotus floridanus]|uniref:Uncharacterized protein n=1 Tax=Camponotus floridanus TaxID=104421 RepID=E2AR21_CAMFO|nr:hypothetical protein EAG_08269 [Camponotus floridanus]